MQKLMSLERRIDGAIVHKWTIYLIAQILNLCVATFEKKYPGLGGKPNKQEQPLANDALLATNNSFTKRWRKDT